MPLKGFFCLFDFYGCLLEKIWLLLRIAKIVPCVDHVNDDDDDDDDDGDDDDNDIM